MGEEFFFKKRFVWMDPSDRSFHWSRTDDRSVAHKRIRLTDRVVSVVATAKGNGFIVTFCNGETLRMKVTI